ncbi:unnamed protein product [Bathycoccus prasinos]|jgi:hypothetical protein
MFRSATKYLFIASSSLCVLGYLRDKNIVVINSGKIKNSEVRKCTEICVDWSAWLETNRKFVWNQFFDAPSSSSSSSK